MPRARSMAVCRSRRRRRLPSLAHWARTLDLALSVAFGSFMVGVRQLSTWGRARSVSFTAFCQTIIRRQHEPGAILMLSKVKRRM